jgi:acyl carrier protein
LSDLEKELSAMIVRVLNLEGIAPEEIGPEEDLFSEEGLALDSIDALEIGVSIQKTYGIKLDSKDDKLAQHFKTVRSIAQLVETHKDAATQ